MLSAVAASVAGLTSTPSPSGAVVADVIWTILAASLASMIAGRAVKAWRPTMARSRRSMIAVGLVAAMFWVRVPGPVGAEVLVCAVALVVLAVYGEVRKPARRRRWLPDTKVLVGALAVVGTVGMGIGYGVSLAAANEMRASLVRSMGFGVQAADDLRDLNFELGRSKMELSTGILDRYDSVVNGWRGRLMGVMPVMGHQRRYVRDVVGHLHEVSDRAVELVETDPRTRLSLRAGTMNLSAMQALEEPLARLTASVTALSESVRGASPWVSGEMKATFAGLAEAVGNYAGTLQTMTRFVAMMPGAAGSSAGSGGGVAGPRTYVVQVVSHEGLGAGGGVPVATGVLTADKGTVSVRFGLAGVGAGGGTVGVDEPDFAVASAAARAGFEKALGRPISGIFHVDVTALADMVEALGELKVRGVGGVVTLTAETVPVAIRTGAGGSGAGFGGVTAGEVADALASALLGLDQVPMQVLAQSWAEAVENGNLKMWFADEGLASLAADMGADGSLGEPGSVLDVVVVSSDVVDGGGWLMRREVDVDATVDAGGRGSARVKVTLVHNGAQSRRIVTTVYSAMECSAADSTTTVTNAGRVGGWTTYAMTTTVAARSSVTLSLSCAGSGAGSDAAGAVIAPRVRGQVTANGDEWSVRVKGPAGEFELNETVNRNAWTEVPALTR